MVKVITYGTFDLFHEGHYRLLKRAKALGDYLIVGVTTESFDEARGKLNVVDSLMTRIENVKKTGFADEVIVEDHIGQKVEDIQKFGANIFVLGSDWTGQFDYLKDFCEVRYLERTKGISSTMKRVRNHKIIRMGLMGSGRIARRFVPEAKYVSGMELTGVFNPHVASAKRFAEEMDCEFYTGDEEEFYEHVDAVDICVPHEFHYIYAKNALEHGKHVLCEKPMTLRKAEAEELFDLAQNQGLILMEAVKTAYTPGFIRLLSMAQSGVIGEIRDVESCFTSIFPRDSMRELTNEMHGGSFTEYGSYTLLPIIKLLGKDYQDIRFECFKGANGVDLYTKAYFHYPHSMATAKTGLKVKSDGHLLISGTRGYILASAPWWKTAEFEICYEDFTQNEKVYTKYLGDGLRYELSDFVSAINGNPRGGFKLTRNESIAMAEIMEKFLAWRNSTRIEEGTVIV